MGSPNKVPAWPHSPNRRTPAPRTCLNLCNMDITIRDSLTRCIHTCSLCNLYNFLQAGSWHSTETAHQQNCRKVMFSAMSGCHYVHMGDWVGVPMWPLPMMHCTSLYKAHPPEHGTLRQRTPFSKGSSKGRPSSNPRDITHGTCLNLFTWGSSPPPHNGTDILLECFLIWYNLWRFFEVVWSTHRNIPIKKLHTFTIWDVFFWNLL